MRLRDVQHAMLADLLVQTPRSPEARARAFRQPPAGSVEDRWGVYASGAPARVAEALENDYPALRRILGDDAFRSLAARYAVAHPPRSFDLGRAGDRLAGFLETDPLREELAFLPDLARLEWAMAEALIARDAEPLAWSALQALGPEAAADLPLAWTPGVALVASAWPIHDLWLCRDQPDAEVDVGVEGRPQTVLVYRRGLDVASRLVDATDADLLDVFRHGGCLAALDVGGDAAPLIVIERFRRLVGEGLLSKEDTCRTPTPGAC
jgi:hypothetical protein